MGSRDDQFWAEFLGIDSSKWESSGVSVRAHVGLAGYRGLWCFRRCFHEVDRAGSSRALGWGRVVVSAPAGWVASPTARLERCDPDALFDETFLTELLDGDFERLIGPSFQGCLRPGGFRPAPSRNVRFIARSDAAAVDRFRAECGDDEWNNSGLDKVKQHMTAHFDGTRIVAMAGYRPWNNHAGDPCVLTHPEFRQRGCGTAVASAVVAATLEEGILLLYQTLESNRGAVRTALNLGYEQYARHIAVRLKRASGAV
jgi:GNAT superfamily N-acetyltransferase